MPRKRKILLAERRRERQLLAGVGLEDETCGFGYAEGKHDVGHLKPHRLAGLGRAERPLHAQSRFPGSGLDGLRRLLDFDLRPRNAKVARDRLIVPATSLLNVLQRVVLGGIAPGRPEDDEIRGTPVVTAVHPQHTGDLDEPAVVHLDRHRDGLLRHAGYSRRHTHRARDDAKFLPNSRSVHYPSLGCAVQPWPADSWAAFYHSPITRIN